MAAAAARCCCASPPGGGRRVGLIDLPSEPAQPALRFDPASGCSWLVVGAGRSGRTTALATAALTAAGRLPPQELEIHVVDADGALAALLADLPHVATCLGPGALDLAARLAERLRAEPPPTAPDPLAPARRVGRGSPRPPTTPGRPHELLAGLLTGPGRAAALVTGDRSLLSPGVAAAFDQRFALRLADRGDYALLGVPAAGVPGDAPPGRAVRAADGAEVQFGGAGGMGPGAGRDELPGSLRWPRSDGAGPATPEPHGRPGAGAADPRPPGRGCRHVACVRARSRR